MQGNDQTQLKTLILQIANRDQYAFKQLFENFYNALVNFAYSYTLDRATAEDIVSELMLKIWNLEDKIKDINNIQHYLYQSVKNRSLNTIKDQAKFQHTLVESQEPSYLTPENILISKERGEFIQQAIDNLPPKCRTVFIMIRDNQLSYKEVSELLDISINTVNRHMQDALNKLYDKLLK